MGRRRQLLVAAALAAGGAAVVTSAVRGEAVEIAKAPAFPAADLYAPAGDDWITNGGSTTNQRYSTLDDIDTSNVGKLKLAWKIHLKSGGTRAYSQEATPVVYK